MSFRSDFTFKKAELILWIDAQEWYPIEDYSKRSEHEQSWLFSLGLSKCDGVKKISPHQYESSPKCLASDIYIDDGTGKIDNRDVYIKAHEHWSKIGGDSMIDWDIGHFQMTKK